jgi:hypothetical protein
LRRSCRRDHRHPDRGRQRGRHRCTGAPGFPLPGDPGLW